MTGTEIGRWLDEIDGLWDHRKLSGTLRTLLIEEVSQLRAIPFEESCEVLKRLRLGTGAFAPVEKIVEAMRLRDRQVAANVARQNAGFAANRAAAVAEDPPDASADHAAARAFVRRTPLEELHRLRDRCRSRRSKYARCLMDNLAPIESKILGSGTTAKAVEKPAQVIPLDWSDRDAILERLWVCMGLWMEHTGANNWSPIGDAA